MPKPVSDRIGNFMQREPQITALPRHFAEVRLPLVSVAFQLAGNFRVHKLYDFLDAANSADRPALVDLRVCFGRFCFGCLAHAATSLPL